MKVSKDFYVGFKMIDETLRLKSSELLNLLVDVAGVQSESIGDGFCSAREKWIVVGYSVKVFKKPEYTANITLTTWSRNYTRAEAFREFEVRDERGQLLIVALADFVRFDPYERKLKGITPELMDAYCSEPDSTNFEGERVAKYVEPDGYDGEEIELVDWKWLDLNRHMNNSHYLDLATHVISSVYGVDLSQKSFEITYKKEIVENTKVRVYYKALPCGEYKVSIKSEDGKTLHAGVRLFDC